jgi:hypothetical protein
VKTSLQLPDRFRKSKSNFLLFEKCLSISSNFRLDESPTSPVRARKAIKVSEIKDQKEKLNAFRLERNTRKLNEIQEQRSPFIVTVPVGRWVEKKERVRPIRMDFNNTPVRAALMNERVLKKSTVKNLIANSTAKKENVMVFNGKPKPIPVKSKKKILGELNAVVSRTEPENDVIVPLDLNSTFEISPEKIDSPMPVVVERLRRSKSFAEIVKTDVVSFERKAKTPPAKKAVKSKTPLVKRKINLVVKKQIIAKKPAPEVKKIVPLKRQVTAVINKKALKPSKSTIETVESISQPSQDVAPPKPAAKKKEPPRSQVYTLYYSSLTTQIKFLTMGLYNLTSSKDSFFELLTEDQQMSVDEAIQQGNLLITDKLGKFAEFLNKYEDDLTRPEDPKRVTDDDVENYWYLIYEEIEKLKEDLVKVQAMKTSALAVVASAKKRRTRRTYIPDDGTPKRSRRIADNADTPK